MTDTPTPPDPGQPLWGDDLNNYLLSLEARIAANEALFATEGGRISAVETTVAEQGEWIASIDGRVAAVESKPEYIYNSYSWQFSPAPAAHRQPGALRQRRPLSGNGCCLPSARQRWR